MIINIIVYIIIHAKSNYICYATNPYWIIEVDMMMKVRKKKWKRVESA